MTAIKAYLMRVILCGFLVSLCTALLRGKRAEKLVVLCGGCLMILTVIRPLMQVDLSALPNLWTGLTQSERQAQAREKNEQILRGLVEAQTVQWLDEQAAELGMQVQFAVSAVGTEEGLYVPDRVTVTGSWTPEQRRILSDRMEHKLSLPPERQEWEGG